VIRFQKRNFDIFATMISVEDLVAIALWFAFKKGTLIYLQQWSGSYCNTFNSCDSLSKKELWYICNNCSISNTSQGMVVIRFQKRNFDIFATIDSSAIFEIEALWFAFKKGTLIYLQQFLQSIEKLWNSCDSLSKKELWYICNNFRRFLFFYQPVVIRFQKRNFDIFATINSVTFQFIT